MKRRPQEIWVRVNRAGKVSTLMRELLTPVTWPYYDAESTVLRPVKHDAEAAMAANGFAPRS